MTNIDKIFEENDAENYLKAVDEFSAIAFTKEFFVQNVDISSRVFHHWIRMGLIDVKISETRIKHAFSLVEFIWLKLIKRLRDFGYPLDKIKILKDFLIIPYDFGSVIRNLSKEDKERFVERIDNAFLKDDSEKQKLKKIAENDLNTVEESNNPVLNCFLFLVITEFLLYRRDVRLLIDINAKCIVDTGDTKYLNLEAEMQQIEFDRDSYLNISLISLFKSIVSDKRYINYIKENDLLNENELHILSLLRDGKAKSITIKFKNLKPHIIEVTHERKIYAESRLSEVMLSRGYQDITIKTENGSIAVTNITTKKKLD